MSIEFFKHIIENYGYLALFIGTFLEGETILLLAGFAAQSPEFHLDLRYVILSAFAGSLAGDQTAFFIGRYFGRRLMEKSEKWRARTERVTTMLKKYHEILILSFRFFYGLRNLTPFVLGSIDIPVRKFFVLNAIGAAIWAVAFALIGYGFGSLLENVLARLIDNVHYAELAVLGLAALAIVAVWILKLLRRR
ncbi:SNARE associated golgi family protein [Solidesulfovibrio carbinoliphilus subsp. oakridgensis]|uniref:SNARE associated golgi family protein n=1 Tax=Solidesulfovibrio carbinoliphilus subsp. oakridgensis TaxID=694327 RepID=G7Q453_9BACT|nr:DedA family protein [Solidesulfovibrio carbinoliphilus]EHJ46843.1 SNARE associated golgi family protein [Solidesulfovibrio carbinoliphilus subsp. oakridgensis]